MMRMVVFGFGLGRRLATLSRFDCWPCLDDMAYWESVEYLCIGGLELSHPGLAG
jgi:hypothetical protein